MVIISQPRYLPALNYIQRLSFSDAFVVFDTVQRQARGWENRNKLLLPDPKWLTMPIASSSRALIKNSKVDGCDWINLHKSEIKQFYGKARYFDEDALNYYYSNLDGNINSDDGTLDFSGAVIQSLKNISVMFDLSSNIIRASEIISDSTQSGPSKLLELCLKIGTNAYISGPNGREYGVDECFRTSGIRVVYHDYVHPEYYQINGKGAFVPYMAFFDALFNMGPSWVRKHLVSKPMFNQLNGESVCL